MQTPVITWFEIPAADFERAVSFYEALFGGPFERMEMPPGEPNAIFPYQRPNPSGAIIAAPHMKPSSEGTVVYLSVGDRLDAVLEQVPTLGGTVLVPRIDLPDIGAIAHIVDPEGNRVGLHQPC